jgi:hypothetical protein
VYSAHADTCPSRCTTAADSASWHDPALPAPEEPDPDQVKQVLDLATTYFPDADQLSIAACYVEALGGRWMQIPGGLSARFATAGMSLHYRENRLSWIGPSTF